MSGVREITGAGDVFGTGAGEGGDTFADGGVTGGASLGNGAIGSGVGVIRSVDGGVIGAAQAAVITATPSNKITTTLVIRIHTFYLIEHKIVVYGEREYITKSCHFESCK